MIFFLDQIPNRPDIILLTIIDNYPRLSLDNYLILIQRTTKITTTQDRNINNTRQKTTIRRKQP